MTVLLEAAVKISMLVGIGLLASALFRHRSAAFRHWILATVVAAALATPILMRVAPSWGLPVASSSDTTPFPVTATAPRGGEPRIGISTSIERLEAAPAPTGTPLDAASILLTLWIVGVVANFAALARGFWTLHRTASRATIVDEGPWADVARELQDRFGLRTPVRLLLSDQPAVLVTWGLIAPKVMLPVDAASWDVERIRVVLAHEFAHVQRRDWIIQIASEALRIANWFNPLVWLASSRLRLESERACDDAVVGLGVSGCDYAQHLLQLARQFGRARHQLPAVAIVPRPSILQRRVTAMLNPHLSRRPLSVATRLGILAALLVVALPIALFGQNRFSTLSGTVTDPSGGLLPGVTVVAIDTTRGVRHEVVTSRTGQFEIIGLPEGSHVLEATVPGFRKFQQSLTLDGQDVNRDITMRIGGLQETISVVRGAPPRSFEGQRSSPKPAACGASPAAATGTLRIGGQIRQPAKTRHVAPIYPEGASSGVVILEAVIGPNGLVTDSKVLRTPATELSLAAENAVRQWEFTPTLLNCVPVPVIMTVTVDFN